MFKDLALSLMLTPSRLKFWGSLLSQFGFVLTILGLFLQVDLKAMALLQSLSRVTPAKTGIESILPGLPTWFIPESAEGFAFWALVTAMGLYCQYLAKVIKRVYSWNV
jgi:hypothetical protein